MRISGDGGSLSLFPVIDLFVDLPSDRRGIHLSRDPESLYEVLREQVPSKVSRIEDFCEIIARRLLEKHIYANRAEVRLRSDYVVTRQSPGMGLLSQEPCKIFALVTATRRDDNVAVDRMVGVRVTGFTACPCTQELLKSITEERLRKLGWQKGDVKKIMDTVPFATHTQRTDGTILMQVPRLYSVNLEDLIDIAEDSMSGRTYTLLKRPAEASLVEAAHKKARFTEDVVRGVLWALAEKYQNFPDEARVFAQAYSSESVHKQDIVAERVATLGEIRSEINENKRNKGAVS